mmetsp:Transcript_2000/g.5627  ORF Transcript_2000/g.5627 Transcript_2000/m.5627 type:complete len:241 (+) Transcript_2000:356-1078(+)
MLLIERNQSAQSLRLQCEEAVEHFVHGAAIDEHRAHLPLLPIGDVQLEDLVHALLVMQRGLDDQVDGPAQIHKVLLREVEDFLRGLLIGSLLRLLLLGVCGRVVAAGTFLLKAENVSTNVFPLCLVGRVLLRRLGLEDVERLLALDGVVEKVNLVCDLVLFIYEVQLLHQAGKVRVLLAPNLEEPLDHILHAPVDLTLMQDVSEALVDRHAARRTQFFQHLPDLLHETHADLDRVVRHAL